MQPFTVNDTMQVI